MPRPVEFGATPEDNFLYRFGYHPTHVNAKLTSVREVVEAIRKNGVRQIYGEYFLIDEDNKVTGACAMGQAALNLSCEADALNTVLNDLQPIVKYDDDDHAIPYLGGMITSANDDKHWTYEEIASYIEKHFDLDDKVYIRKMFRPLEVQTHEPE